MGEYVIPKNGTTAEYRKLAESAEDRCDWRMATILLTLAIYAYPENCGAFAKADKNALKIRLDAAKYSFTHTCPVCGNEMNDTACCDDIIRPACSACGKTYVPMGYTEDENYGLKWHAKTWDGGAEPDEIIEVPA